MTDTMPGTETGLDTTIRDRADGPEWSWGPGVLDASAPAVNRTASPLLDPRTGDIVTATCARCGETAVESDDSDQPICGGCLTSYAEHPRTAPDSVLDPALSPNLDTVRDADQSVANPAQAPARNPVRNPAQGPVSATPTGPAAA